MKIVIKGVTIVVAMIPTGAKVPNALREYGAVNICAEVEADKDALKYPGRNLIRYFLNNLLKHKIPANAPYDKMKPLLV